MVSPSPSYTSIPLIVRLWKDPYSGDHSSTHDWKGHRICLVNDTDDLDIYNFNNCTSAIEIIPGPNYDPNVDYKVSFYAEKNYGGAILELGIGRYPNLEHPHNFDDMISSVKFPAGQQSSQINSKVDEIAIVAELYEHPDWTGKKLIVVEDINNLADYNFNKKVKSVKVHKGPAYTPENYLKLCEEIYNSGQFNPNLPHIDIYPDGGTNGKTNGEYDLTVGHFANKAQSVKFC
jgi:hypothetical protein